MQRRRSARLAAAPLAGSDASSPSTPARGGRASMTGKGKGNKGAATAAAATAGGPWVTVADVVLLGAMLLYLFLCPYNKVGG